MRLDLSYPDATAVPAPEIPKPWKSYSMRMPEMARAITSRWICSGPAKMS